MHYEARYTADDFQPFAGPSRLANAMPGLDSPFTPGTAAPTGDTSNTGLCEHHRRSKSLTEVHPIHGFVYI
jgi:hypothetical protein